MARAYYGSRISQNRTKTPEGYLICHGVPIARTGYYEYLGRELGVNGDNSVQMFRVYRSPDEVFAPAAIASFEGKIVTDEHPCVELDTSNYNSYIRGIARDVRQGSGEESDLLIADLLIYDIHLISEVEAGKKEVSCGYNCDYDIDVNSLTGAQHNIRGNHVAIVSTGRAGDRVAIKDKKPHSERSTKMDKAKLFGRMFSAFVKTSDATPEEIAEATKMYKDGEETPQPQQTQSNGATMESILAAVNTVGENIKSLTERVSALEESDKNVHKELNPLDEIEKELSGEEKTPTVIEPEKKEEMAMDKADMLNFVKTMKPVIVAMPDAARKTATDSLVKFAKGHVAGGQYANIMQSSVKPSTDSIEEQQRNLGRKLAEQYNPHYRKDVK